MQANRGSRADLHCHSTASRVGKLGLQRSIGLPECATPPQEVYELAKRRGMDFVTITDHDSIDGVLEIADLPDVFVSEELTARFKGEAQAVHVLCYGITPDDHERLQALVHDVEACAAYIRERDITCALAHPFFAVQAPLTPRHRRRLAELFPIWETRNGSRPRELNAPAAIYIETHSGTGVAGSDDHAGIDVGRTWTQTPQASGPEQFLSLLRTGEALACGDEGSPAKWAHSAIAIATRVLERGAPAPLDPFAVLAIAARASAGSEDEGLDSSGPVLTSEDGRALLEAWIAAMGIDARGPELIALFQADDFSHADLFRRARHLHERGLRRAVERALVAVASSGDLGAAAAGLFDACVPAIPYAPPAAFIGREKARLVARENERPRVALVADAIGGMHGVTHTLDQIRERGVPGFEVEVIGTDPSVDRRLAAAAEVDIPFYAGFKVGVPSLPALVETLAEGRYQAIHLCSPGPSGVAAAVIGRAMGTPIVGSYHTELAAYAGLRSGNPGLEAQAAAFLGAFYGQCRTVLSPSRAADQSLRELGIAPERIARWDRGVDLTRFDPVRRRREADPADPAELRVLYAGRLTVEKGMDLLVDSFLAAREHDLRQRLVLAGGGPEEAALRARLGDAADFLGWLEGDDLARAYADADVFLFASRTDTFGQVILEAQASGLAVVAVDEGGPRALIDDGVSGRLCRPEPRAMAAAVLDLAASPKLRARLALAALARVRARPWDRSLAQLAGAYHGAVYAGAEARRAA